MASAPKINTGKLVYLSYMSYLYGLSERTMKERELAGTAEVEKRPREKPEERDHRAEEARMVKKTTGTHRIPGLDREPRAARSLLSRKYIEKYCVYFQVAG